ncbi:MAG: virulence factor [candidate division NC10 bacterium]
MANYQVLYWREIPSLVKATDATGEVSVRLPQRFHDAIDEAAMQVGATDTEAYLAGWHLGPVQQRPGTAREVAEAIAADLAASIPLSTSPDPFREP